MIKPTIPITLDALLDPVSRCPDAESARRILEFRIDSAVQTRLDILGEKANEGTFSDDEREEYEAAINAADFISILKLRVRRNLSRVEQIEGQVKDLQPEELAAFSRVVHGIRRRGVGPGVLG